MFPGFVDIVVCVVLTLCLVFLYVKISDDNKEESPYDKN